MDTILIIDDNEMNVLLLAEVLEGEGFRTLKAYDGPGGRNLAVEQKPDLILLDLKMPLESGLETCRILKNDSFASDIPIIFISADTDNTSKVTVLNEGGVDYITKPINDAEVLARVKIHLRLSQSKRDLIELQARKLKQISQAQKSILIDPWDIPEARFSVYYRPLNEAGGDYYDVLPLADNVYAYFCADVCGHDVGSSLATSALKALIHQNASIKYSLKETIEMINTVLNQILEDDLYITLSYAQLNRSKNILKIVNAGHPDPIIQRKKGEITVLKEQSDVLGAFNHIKLAYHEIPVNKGDRFYLYTDGLIEFHDREEVNRNKGLHYLTEKIGQLENCVLKNRAKAIAENLIPVNASIKDDVLILEVEV